MGIPRGRGPTYRPRRVALLVAAIVLGTAGLLVLALTGHGSDPALALPAPPVVTVTVTVPADPDRLVRFATVTRVDDGMTVHVTIDGVPDPGPIHVDGLLAPIGGECGAPESASHARTMLLGQRVTLVPDAAAPQAGEHLVLPTQLSYTDDAISTGYARVESGAWTYRDAFTREEATARDNRAGLWSGCWA